MAIPIRRARSRQSPRTTLTGPFSEKSLWPQHMTVIANQTPPSRKPRRRQPWRDWLVITLTACGAWFALCWLVAWLAR